MAIRGRHSLARELRRSGVRLHSGPWSVYVGQGEKQLIVSLGRVAGPAISRSRIRRIARSVFTDTRLSPLDAPILLIARGFVGEIPRRLLRDDFGKLRGRIAQILNRQRGTAVS